MNLTASVLAAFVYWQVDRADLKMYEPLKKYVDARIGEFDKIPGGRKDVLQKLATCVATSLKKGGPCRLVFICTHNSRRSHMAQIWSTTAARHFGIEGVHCYSGGTEATAFNPRAVAAMQRAGFKIEKTTEDHNPIYHVRFGDGGHPITCFSKVYNQAPNPGSDFGAVMTCSQADRTCPVVPGASDRIVLAYRDPKEADGTPQETARYDERCRQIAREMLLVFSLVQEDFSRSAMRIP